MTTTTLPGTDTISVQQVRELIQEDPLIRIIDVRSGGEFETIHIPGSFNVPLETLHEHARDLADLEHPVVLVCQSGARASRAHGALTEAGKDRLHLLDGGIAAWEAAGADVVRGDVERWAMDRQVRFVAGSLVLTGLLAGLVVPKARVLAAGVASGLVYSAVSNTCAMGDLLAKLPYNRVDRCDIAGVLDEMRQVA